MQEKIHNFGSLQEIGQFLKSVRLPKFPALKYMAERMDEANMQKFYGCAVNCENGRFPKKGSTQGPLLSKYLDFLGFKDSHKASILDEIYSFAGEIKPRESLDAETKLMHMDGLPAGDFQERLGLNLIEMLNNGEDAILLIEKRHRHHLYLDEMAYVAEQIINSYDSHAKLVSEILSRGKRTNFNGGLIGSTQIGITNIQDCINHDPVDIAKYLGPTLNSLLLRLENKSKLGYSCAKIIKESLEHSRDRYYGQRDNLIKELREYLSKK